jgi:hypothetical protein
VDNVLIALKDIKKSLITLVHGRGVGIAHLPNDKSAGSSARLDLEEERSSIAG